MPNWYKCFSLVYINLGDSDGDTALIAYVQRGSSTRVLELLQYHADVSISNNEGNTAFIEACKIGAPEIVQCLLIFRSVFPGFRALGERTQAEVVITIDVSNNDGYTALHLAIKHGHLHTVRYLVAWGSAIAKQPSDGTTPCRLAITNEYQDIFEFIVAHTANPEDLFINSAKHCE